MKKVIVFSLSLLMLMVANVDSASAKDNKNSKTSSKQQTSSKKVVTTKQPAATVKYNPVKHNGVTYYVNGSKYYKKVNSRYVLVSPPVGLAVSVLSVVNSLVRLSNSNYYQADGVVYEKVNNNYVVVKPTEGTVVPALPDYNVREVVIDGKVFFEYDGILYKQIPTTVGLQYEVVGTLYE